MYGELGKCEQSKVIGNFILIIQSLGERKRKRKKMKMKEEEKKQ